MERSEGGEEGGGGARGRGAVMACTATDDIKTDTDHTTPLTD